MKRKILVWLSLLLMLSVCIRGAVVPVPGTTVSLEPPESFSPATEFPGFANPKLRAFIIVVQFPGPPGSVQDGMTKEVLAAKGLTLLESATEKVDGRNALLIRASQNAAGTEFLKYFLVAGDESETTLVTGTFPKEEADQLEPAIKRSLFSAKWQARKAPDPLEGLHYKVEPTEKLKVAGRVGNTLILSETGRSDMLPPGEARFTVTTSMDSMAMTDLVSSSERRAQATATLQEIKQLESRELTIDGLKAYELVAEAKLRETGLAMRLYQVVVVDGRISFVMQGLVPADRAPEFIPHFKKLAETFRRTK